MFFKYYNMLYWGVFNPKNPTLPWNPISDDLS